MVYLDPCCAFNQVTFHRRGWRIAETVESTDDGKRQARLHQNGLRIELQN
jgi:hypothetical protein